MASYLQSTIMAGADGDILNDAVLFPYSDDEESDVDEDNQTTLKTTTSDTGRGAGSERGTKSFASASKTKAVANFPKTPAEIQHVEEVLAQEMESLSLSERDKILFDIHGISNQEQEDNDKITELLTAMAEELQCPKFHAAHATTKTMEAYIKAKYLNEEYVTSRQFCLMFLRSEGYDPILAASKLIQHFHIKRELFGSSSNYGEDILGRDVRLSDLSPDDIQTLESGFFQICPSRDVAGRSIFFQAPRHRICKSYDDLARVNWYIFMTALRQDEDLQRKGFVLLVYNYGGVPTSTLEELRFLKAINKTVAGLPQKLVACHFCGLNPLLRPFTAGIRLFLGKELRTRLKDHYGSYSDIVFKMQTFGIKAEDHPMKEDLSLSLEWHHEWIQIQKNEEENHARSIAPGDQVPTTDTNKTVIVPRRFDVLFGRGKIAKQHTGNLRAQHLVDMYMPEYEAANKFNKTTIAERILDIITESYGRFLKWDDQSGCWVEVDRDTARDKVSHYFRIRRSKKKPAASSSATSAGSNESERPKRTSPYRCSDM